MVPNGCEERWKTIGPPPSAVFAIRSWSAANRMNASVHDRGKRHSPPSGKGTCQRLDSGVVWAELPGEAVGFCEEAAVKETRAYREQTRTSHCGVLLQCICQLSAMLLMSCGSGEQNAAPSAPPAVVVEVSQVRREAIRDVVDLVGQLEAEESVMIKPETEGTIASIEFREGSRVAEGALLFRLRDDEQRARLREAEAALTLSRADYERAQTLRKRQAISEAELDRALSRWQQSAAERDLAEVELRRTEIRAPFGGVLGARLVAPGDRVDRDVGLVEIESVDRLRLVFSIPEIGVGLARQGTPVTITVAPFPDRSFTGEVYFVAPSLDPRTRRLLLKAWVSNAEGVLKPGLFAQIRVEIARHDDALTIPEAALAYDAGGAYVWRVGESGHAERVAVDLGIRRAGRVEVAGGALREGDRLVSAGTNKIFPGAIVRASDPTPIAEAAAP
jgi:membrane fusion protein (multidrug efflux system)